MAVATLLVRVDTFEAGGSGWVTCYCREENGQNINGLAERPTQGLGLCGESVSCLNYMYPKKAYSSKLV